MANPPDPTKLTPKQLLAVSAFMAGHATYKSVGDAVGVHYTTIARWMKQPEFRDALEDAQEKQLEFITRALLDASPRAVEAIHDALDFSSDASDVDVTSMFAMKTITIEGEKIKVPVLDFDKLKKSKKFVKKIKSSKNELSVEVVDVVQAKNLGLRAAELILGHVIPYKDTAEYEKRLQALEDKLDDSEEDE